MNFIAARIRWTVPVCTVVCGHTASIASGRPVSPSQQAISTSRTPRLRSLVHTWAQNLAPSACWTQMPSTCLGVMPGPADGVSGDLTGVHAAVPKPYEDASGSQVGEEVFFLHGDRGRDAHLTAQ